MRGAAIALMVLTSAACSRNASDNYRRCLKLRLGMTREEALKIMGTPDETLPFSEGKSLPHLRGRTAYEWANPVTMPGPNHVSVEEATGKVASVRCSDVVVSASVFIEPPSTAAVQAVKTAPAAAQSTAHSASRGRVGTGAPGRALTGDEPR